MKTDKTLKVVMLPTEKASHSRIVKGTSLGKLELSDCVTGEVWSNPYYKPQELYIISNQKIKIGDIPFIPDGMLQYKSIGGVVTIENIDSYYSFNASPVIASTDKSIIPNSFIGETFVKVYIQNFNEGNIIEEVDVELVELRDGTEATMLLNGRPKARPDGSIIIRQSKVYSRMEVVKILSEYREYVLINGFSSKYFLDEWIKENL